MVTFTEEILNGKLHFCAVCPPGKGHSYFDSPKSGNYNSQKSSEEPKQVKKFLRFIINSKTMTVYLSETKIEKIVCHCEKAFLMEKVTLRELTSLIEKLTSTYQALLLDPLHYWGEQLYQIRKNQKILS